MSLTNLLVALPDYASDLKINLARVATEPALTNQQKWGCFLACALTVGQPALVSAVAAEAKSRLTAEARKAVEVAAAIMAMNTVYYGAVNLLHNHDYRADRPNFSMTGLADPGIDKIDFELWAFAVSAISNCAACLNTHEAELHKRGVELERVRAVLRIAAVMNAVGVVLRAEAAT